MFLMHLHYFIGASTLLPYSESFLKTNHPKPIIASPQFHPPSPLLIFATLPPFFFSKSTNNLHDPKKKNTLGHVASK